MIDARKRHQGRKRHLPPAWRDAIESLDAAFEKNTPHDNRELIELFGKAHFGDLWDLRKRESDSSQS